MFNTYRRLTWAVVRLVNAPRSHSPVQRAQQLLLKPAQRQKLIEAGRLIYERGLSASTTGALSLRLDNGRLAITTAQADLANLSEASMTVCPVVSARPAGANVAHLAWHRAIYQDQPAAQGIVWCQPVYTMVLLGAGLIPQPEWAPEVAGRAGGMALLPASTAALPADLAGAAGTHHALLLPGSGALVWGDSLAEAVHRAEALEYLARLTVTARQADLVLMEE